MGVLLFVLNFFEQVFGPEIYKILIINLLQGGISKFMTFFNADKVFTFPLLVIIMAGFSLSCSNNPLMT